MKIRPSRSEKWGQVRQAKNKARKKTLKNSTICLGKQGQAIFMVSLKMFDGAKVFQSSK